MKTLHAHLALLATSLLAADHLVAAAPRVLTESLESAPTATLLLGRFDGGPMDEVLVLERRDQQVALRRRALDGDAGLMEDESVLDGPIDWVDVVSLGDRDALLFHGDGRLVVRELGTGQDQVLPAVVADLPSLADHLLAHVQVSRDLDGDGLDELLIPVQQGIALFRQSSPGQFEPPRVIPAPAVAWHRLAYTGYRLDPWSMGRLHLVDFNGDGRNDLAWWNGNGISILHAREDGFSDAETSIALPIELDGDEPAALAAPIETRHRVRDTHLEGRSHGTVLWSLADVNNDGVPDMVTFTLGGDSLWRMKSRIEWRFGQAHQGQIQFPAEADTGVTVDGIPFDVTMHDVNGDGLSDLAMTRIDPGIIKAIGLITSAVFTGAVTEDLLLYRLHQQGVDERPAQRLRVKTGVEQPVDEGAAQHPFFAFTDATGDGSPDLVVGRPGRDLAIHAFDTERARFDRKPIKLDCQLPIHEAWAWWRDVDGDGREDLVLHRAGEGELALVLMP